MYLPPTEKKWPVQLGAQEDQTSAEVASGSKKVSALNNPQLGQVNKSMATAKRRTPSNTQKLDCSDKRGLTPGHTDLSASTSADSADEDRNQDDIQIKILK